MTLYSVFDRRLDEAPAIVPDGFSWFAALLPAVYGLVHGLWLALIGYLAIAAAIFGLSLLLGTEAAVWLYLLFAILIGFEASSLRRRALRWSGYIYRSEMIAAAPDLAALEWLKRRSTGA